MIAAMHRRRRRPRSPQLFLIAWASARAVAAAGAAAVVEDFSLLDTEQQKNCLTEHFPEARSGLPTLLNCLGLTKDAAEIGVQAGVHAQSFLEHWEGDHLWLVDKWSPSEDHGTGNTFYIDIANVNGPSTRRQHLAHCSQRLKEPLASGRATILEAESSEAALRIADHQLDFVYLDARHDLPGVVTDIKAWWPKVRPGGIFAGHDYVDGEFPEGDFFWITALKEALPELEGSIHMTKEANHFPSFFVIKTERLISAKPKNLDPLDTLALDVYKHRSRYFQLWKDTSSGAGGTFDSACRDTCHGDCQDRASRWSPTLSAGSTLRPFACKEAEGNNDVCGAELVVDVEAYVGVCQERCNITCRQRGGFFDTVGPLLLAA